jgi:hypothetical protein
MLFFQSLFNRAVSLFHSWKYTTPALDKIVKKQWIKSNADEVYNFSVEEDESYVAAEYVVHNCRSGIRSLTTKAAEKKGITSSPPNVKASEGFGSIPEVDGWEPDLSGFDSKLLEIHKEKQP